MLPVRSIQSAWLPEIFNDFFGNEWTNKTNFTAPAMNIMETENSFDVEIAAPGMTKEDVNVKLDEDNSLIIFMEKKQEATKEDKKSKYLRKDFSYSSFQQSLVLPDTADLDKIEASVENGILKIVIPKLNPVNLPKKERAISIK